MLNPRRIFPILLLLACAGALAWAVSFGTLPPAEFTFINGTEVQSLDPAIVTGQPEGRIINALFEGLYHPMPDQAEPENLRPTPGAAEKCDISDDGKTYTFTIRTAARWSDGEPMTAHDFVWSWRRFLHPETASEYAYQLHYAVGAAKYNSGKVEVGDRVEVELDDRPQRYQLFPRGTIVSGVLNEIRKPPEPNLPDDMDEERKAQRMADWRRRWVYVVDVYGKGREDVPVDWREQNKGKTQRFSKDPRASGATKCLWVLPHWSSVGIQAKDNRTLIVQLNDPTPYFLDLVAFYPLYPVNRACVEKYGVPNWTKPGNIVSNGPFVMEFRRIRDRIRMRKNPQYWDADAVELQSVDALAVESEATQLNMYMDGQVDWATTIPNALIPELEKRDDFYNEVQLGTYFYRLNCRRPPLDDHRVRAALNMAMNKESIVQFVTQGGQKQARSFVPPGIPDYEGAMCGEQDLEEAKKLLADAGFPGGEGFPTIDILYNNSEGHTAIAEVVQQQWKKLGINVQLKQVAWGVYLDFVSKGKYDVARAGWIGDYPDPNTFLDMFVTDGPNNQTGWSNPIYDELIAAAKSEGDKKKRLALFHDAEAILMDNWDAVKDMQLAARLQKMRASDPKTGGQPLVPIYFYVSINMVRPYVRGVPPYDKYERGFFGNIQDIHPLSIIRIDPEEKRTMLREAGVR